MKKCFLLILLALFSLAVHAEEVQKDNVFYFFYSYKCPHCHEAQPFIAAIEKEYPDITFKKLEVLQIPENMKLFREMTQKLGIQGGGVPTFIFNGNATFSFGKYERYVEYNFLANEPAGISKVSARSIRKKRRLSPSFPIQNPFIASGARPPAM